MSLLSDSNPCGQTILRIVSRGSAIIAELLRLSKNVPDVFLGPAFVRDPAQQKYSEVLFDFRYLKDPEPFEQRINSNTDLLDVEDEFQENMASILERFYTLFDNIYKFTADFNRFLEDLMSGYFVQYTVDSLLLETDGKQLVCEALYLLGVMYLLMDQHIPGPARERMIIAYYRSKGESTLSNLDEVCKLCRSTGFVPARFNRGKAAAPEGYPEKLFARFPINAELVRMVIGKLQSDDVYLQAVAFPSPDHRSTRLANQAALLYVILFFAPNILKADMAAMREIVDKHFNDNFIITRYMGDVIDLSIEWERYPAARAALNNSLGNDNILRVHAAKAAQVGVSLQELRHFLTEGVLTEQYVLDNIMPLLNCMRKANVAIRWLMLHRKVQPSGATKRFHDAIVVNGVDPENVMQLLLNTAQLEFQLKVMFEQLLKTKEDRWSACKAQCRDRMNELSQYFSGEQALTRVERDEHLMAWFSNMASQIDSLDFGDATFAGRKIQQLTAALEEVEQFDQIDTSLQIKQFLADSRQLLTQMVRVVNVRPEVLTIIENVSDLSYGWECMSDYVDILHDRVKKAPTSVVLLRAMFLKLASILDVPLVRISQCGSSDEISVAEYYSGELVQFVRKVLAVIPRSVFIILSRIVEMKTNKLKELPVKFEAVYLKQYAQLEERYRLSCFTHQVSVFTEGILAMEKTLLGIIQVDPRLVLADGIRSELVLQVSRAMHAMLVFDGKDVAKGADPTTVAEGRLAALETRLAGFRAAFEYIQDYINIYGLRLWQEEFSRIISYNVEQECNRFLRKKVLDSESRYQSAEIPIPRMPKPPGSASTAANFMGRLMNQLLVMTAPATTVYAPEWCGWYRENGIEACGVSFFNLLQRSVGVLGLAGIDRMLSFLIVYKLNELKKFWAKVVVPSCGPVLEQLESSLQPTWKLPDQVCSARQALFGGPHPNAAPSASTAVLTPTPPPY
jgi:WASH complex subunit strumpellin